MTAFAPELERLHGWLTVSRRSHPDVHIVPCHGSLHEESRFCWCVPTPCFDAPRVLVHREAIETGRLDS